MVSAEPRSTCFACERTNFRRVRAVHDVHANTDRTYEIDVCTKCGSGQMTIRLTDIELARIYPDDYYSYAPQSGLMSTLQRIAGRLTHNRHRFVPTFSRLLEFGCGQGEYLAKIAHRGSVIGLERSAQAAISGKRLGVEIRVGDIECPTVFDAESFDYVYSNHAFEHLSEPDLALASIHRWLVPGGRIFIGIPHFGGLVARIFGKNWYYLGPPLHVTNSTVIGINALLERQGFVVERIVHNSDPISIPMSAFIALGGRLNKVPLVAKVLIGLSTFVALVPVRILDCFKLGDCIEIHARKK